MWQVIVRNKYHSQIAQCFLIDDKDANDLAQTVANRYREYGVKVDVICIDPIEITTAITLIDSVIDNLHQDDD